MQKNITFNFIFLFSCLSGFLIQQSHASSSILLQSISNAEQFESTEGNLIELIKSSAGCMLKATFYGETGQNTEIYHFKDSHFIRGLKYEYSYTLGGLSNLSDNHGNFEIYLNKSTNLDKNDLEVIEDFKTVKSLFPSKYLNQCN